MGTRTLLSIVIAGIGLTGCMGDAVVRTHLSLPGRPSGCAFEVRDAMPVDDYDDVATVTAHVAQPTEPAIVRAVGAAVCEHGGNVFVVTDEENGTVRGEIVRMRSTPS